MGKQLTEQDLIDTFDAFNRHDIDAVMKHFADDCVFYTVAGNEVYGGKVEGKDAKACLKLYDMLEDLDDTQNVYSNFDISDEDIEAYHAG